MRSRPFILFWGASLGAVLFLGAAWTTATRLLAPSGTILDAVTFGLAAVGFTLCVSVAARIVFVTARLQRTRTRR